MDEKNVSEQKLTESQKLLNMLNSIKADLFKNGEVLSKLHTISDIEEGKESSTPSDTRLSELWYTTKAIEREVTHQGKVLGEIV